MKGRRPARGGATARVAALALSLLGAGCGSDDPAVLGTVAPGVSSVGYAHVDLMDLHAERGPDGTVVHREILSSDAIDDRFATARAGGAAWNRWSLYWDLVQTRAGMDWGVADGIVARDVGSGLNSLVILQGTPPSFATGGLAGAVVPPVGGGTAAKNELIAKGDVAPQASPPLGLDRPIFLGAGGTPTDDPERAESVNPANPWAVFVDQAVTRYRPQGTLARESNWPDGAGVRAWEVGNEPNLRHFWSGSPSQFARYLEVAYLVIERADPDALVVHGGIADDASAPTWFRSFLAALTELAVASDLPERYGYYFDASAWHWYAYPDLLRTGPVRARGLLREAGLADKPLWVTEFGVPIWSEYPGPCWDPRSAWRATTLEQAGYYWQAMAEGLASGVEVFTAFQLYDDCGNGPESYDAFGVVRNQSGNQCWATPAGRPCWAHDPALDGTVRVAHEALAALEAAMPLELLWRPVREDGGWQRVVFYSAPNRRLTFAWNPGRAAVQATIRATGPLAQVLTLTDEGVAVQEARAEGGDLHLTLPGASNRNDPSGAALMAGLPSLVIETDTIPPFRADVAAPDTAEGGRFEAVVSAADGGTGVARYELYEAYGDAPVESGDWQLLVADDWASAPLAGDVAVAVEARESGWMHLAVRAWDRAGNASAPPSSSQASVLIGQPTPWTPVARIHLPALMRSFALPGHEARPTRRPPTSTLEPPTAAPGPSMPPQPTASTTPGESQPSPGTPPTQTSPVSATPGETAATQTPVSGPTWTTGPPSDCTPVSVRVTSPRGDYLPPTAGDWVLRAFRAQGEPPVVSEAPFGTGQCVAFAPTRLEAVALAPGFTAYPPQDLSLSTHLALSVAPGALLNGGFEAGLAGWLVGGEAPPAGYGPGLAGGGAAVLGESAAGLDGANSTSLGQEVEVGGGNATLSYMMRSDPRLTCDADGCSLADRLDIIVTDLTRPGRPVTFLTGSDGVREAVPIWAHRWHDLSPWSGRRISLTFLLRQPDGTEPSRVWLDNVSVGPANPPPGR